MSALLLFLTLSAALAWTQGLVEPRVLEARTEGDVVEFTCPVPLPWEELARRALPELDWERPGQTLLERYYFEPGAQSDVPFRAPVPVAVPQAHYIGLSFDGPVPIEIQEIEGEVTFMTRPPSWAIARVVVHPGRVRGRAGSGADPLPSIPFVLWYPQPPAVTTEPARVEVLGDSGDSVRIAVGREGEARTWTLGPDLTWDVTRPQRVSARLYLDSASQRRYLLAVAEEGDLPCPYLAALYDVTATIHQLYRTALCDP